MADLTLALAQSAAACWSRNAALTVVGNRPARVADRRSARRPLSSGVRRIRPPAVPPGMSPGDMPHLHPSPGSIRRVGDGACSPELPSGFDFRPLASRPSSTTSASTTSSRGGHRPRLAAGVGSASGLTQPELLRRSALPQSTDSWPSCHRRLMAEISDPAKCRLRFHATARKANMFSVSSGAQPNHPRPHAVL